MDFTKFVSMLETRALYFTRADQLGDPFEGSYSQANQQMRLVSSGELPQEMQDKLREHKANLAKQIRAATFINCWHMNDGESAGMWKLYTQTNESVAIKSTFSRLANLLSDDFYIGMVDYIDFDKDWVPEGNLFYPFVHKRKSFAHECEVRAVTLRIPLTNGNPDLAARQPLKGIQKTLALDELVESIYVAPTCPEWFRVLVEQVCKRYELNMSVRRSSLDAEPFF
jgi:hypothetical protein